jgi:hypothetical protein
VIAQTALEKQSASTKEENDRTTIRRQINRNHQPIYSFVDENESYSGKQRVQPVLLIYELSVGGP